MNPFKLLFAIFIFIPIIEVYLLIQVGSWIGVVPTVLLVITTAMMGVSMLKSQGLSTLMDAQRSLASGQVPAFQLLEGAALLVSGALLLTPGFVTDFIGFLGLIPVTRKMIVNLFLSRATISGIHMGGQGSHHSFDQREEGVVVDGEFHEKQSKVLR